MARCEPYWTMTPMDRAFLIEPQLRPVLTRMDRLCRGAEAEGYTVSEFDFRNRRSQLPEWIVDCEFAIVAGMRSSSLAGRIFARNHRIPCAVTDLGYMKRASNSRDIVGYNQLGWGVLGWVPKGEISDDRFQALEQDFQSKRRRPGKHILVAGQVPGDAQHNMNRHELECWLQAATMKAQEQFPGIPVVYRPHPLATRVRLLIGDYTVQIPAEVTPREAVADAVALVAFNSTLGVDALLEGVPLICDNGAHFHQAAGGEEELRYDHLCRLAYAQWNLEEFKSGEAIRFMLENKPE